MSTGLLIKTNGQTVIVTATYLPNAFGAPATGNVAFKADVGLSQAVTLPASISADTIWYIADANLPRTAW